MQYDIVIICNLYSETFTHKDVTLILRLCFQTKEINTQENFLILNNFIINRYEYLNPIFCRMFKTVCRRLVSNFINNMSHYDEKLSLLPIPNFLLCVV